MRLRPRPVPWRRRAAPPPPTSARGAAPADRAREACPRAPRPRAAARSRPGPSPTRRSRGCVPRPPAYTAPPERGADRRTEVEDGGIAFPRKRQAGAEVLVRVDPLLRCHLERPVGRDDLAQERQRSLYFEPLIELVRLPQQLPRAALPGQRRRGADREDHAPKEPPHPVPRLRSVTRPSDSVAPTSITTVVSNVS